MSDSIYLLALPVALIVLFYVAYKTLGLFEKVIGYCRIRNGVKRVSMHDAWATANRYTDIRHK
jgi:hydrogenase-4 membrane subunit HyfE